MDVFNLEIITPDRVLFAGKVEEIKLKGIDGYFEILAKHQSYVTAILPDMIKFRTPEGEKKAFVSSGIVKVHDDKAVIVTDAAEWPEEIDLHRAEEAEKRARGRLEQGDKAVALRAEMALKRALAREKTFRLK